MKIIKRLLVSLIVFAICMCGFFTIKPGKLNEYSLKLNIKYSQMEEMHLYYNTDTNTTFYGTQEVAAIFGEGEKRDIEIPMKEEYKSIQLAFKNPENGGQIENRVKLSDAKIKSLFCTLSLDLSKYERANGVDIEKKGNDITVDVQPDKSYILYDLTSAVEDLKTKNGNVMNIIYIIVSVLVALIVFRLAGKVKLMLSWLRDIISNRRLIFELSKSDFKMRYAGSNLGVVWAFVQPIVTVIIYVFVFQVGFKSVPVENVPYVLWLVAGIVPWFFLSEALMNATNSLLEYSYLVKKVVFKINILPMVKIMSALYVHLFFVVIAISMYLINGIPLTIYAVQIVYYSLCTTMLVLGLAYITSSIVIFFRDLSQIVNIMLQFGMWLTPIMYSIGILPPKFRAIMKLNPMFYVTDGYRDALYNKVWFFEKTGQTMYFWVLAVLLLLVGSTVFKKLEKHFADVL